MSVIKRGRVSGAELEVAPVTPMVPSAARRHLRLIRPFTKRSTDPPKASASVAGDRAGIRNALRSPDGADGS